MNFKFQEYKPRYISFQEVVEANGWKIKVYTISIGKKFGSNDVLGHALRRINEWVGPVESLTSFCHRTAFLIVHEGRDGVWTISNAWTGGEMLRTDTFFTDKNEPNKFRAYPEKGSMACVWEMKVIIHEREAWIKHILKSADSPKFDLYFDDTLTGVF